MISVSHLMNMFETIFMIQENKVTILSLEHSHPLCFRPLCVNGSHPGSPWDAEIIQARNHATRIAYLIANSLSQELPSHTAAGKKKKKVSEHATKLPF